MRYLHIVDVPESWTSYVQRVGRAVRAFGHHLLSDNEQKVRVYLHVATLPQEMPAESKDLKLRAALDEVSSEFSDVNIFLSKEQVMEVVKNLRKRGVKTPTPAKLMQRAEYAKFPEHGMNFQELKDLISMTQKKSKGANGEARWPKQTVDEIMWEWLQEEHKVRSPVLQKLKESAADFSILSGKFQQVAMTMSSSSSMNGVDLTEGVD